MSAESDRKELVDKVRRLVRDRFAADFGKAFAHYDIDKDGKIDADELNELLKDSGVGNFITRSSWVSAVIGGLDADKDFKISLVELMQQIEPHIGDADVN